MTQTPSERPFVFGIYPGGGESNEGGTPNGPPENPAAVERALRELEGQEPLLIRAYERFSDANAPSPWARRTPERYEQYLGGGRPLDLVLMFQSASGDVEGYLDFIRAVIGRQDEQLYSLQITEEANFTQGPSSIDGPWPRALEALVRGVVVAKEELRRRGSNALVGFNATPTFGAAAEFWSQLAHLGNEAFRDAVDYVGLDFFPDVFRRVEADGQAADLAASTTFVLEAMRHTWLPAARLPESVPIHITEHGWATAADRPPERQAEVLERVLRLIHGARQRLNITRYTSFCLRDTNSRHASFFYQFGLLRDDYSPKPAFRKFGELLRELRPKAPSGDTVRT